MTTYHSDSKIWSEKVLAHYPAAILHKEKTYGGATHYTVYDPSSRSWVGPTAFTEDNAWKWAAERIK